MKEVYENRYGKSWYNEDLQVLYEKCTGIVNFELAMEMLEKNMAFMKNNPIKGDVVDLSEIKGTFTKINNFLEKEYVPFIMRQGGVGLAITLSKDIFSQYAMNDLLRRIGSFEIKVFNDVNEAEEWMKEKVKNSEK